MLKQEGLDLRWFLAVIRRWLWLIIAGSMLAAAVAFYFTSRIVPVYQATATLLIQPAQSSSTNEYNNMVTGERLARTYSQLLKAQPVLDAVISNYKLSETSSQLAQRVTIQQVEGTQLIRLTVTDSAPARAVILANAIAQAFKDNLQTFQTERYAGSLSNMQTKKEELSSSIELTLSKLQTLNLQKTSNETKQAELEGLLEDYRSSYQQLQLDYRALQSTVSPLTDGVSITEPARPWSSDPATTAVVTFIVEQPPAGSGAGYSVDTYERLLAGRSILEAAIAKLGLDLDPDILTSQMEIKSIPDTQLFQLRVVDESIEQATRLADAISQVFIDQMEALHEKPYTERMGSLQAQIDELELQIGKTQVDLASLSAEQVEVGTEIANLESQLAGYRSEYNSLGRDYSLAQLTVAGAADTVVITEPASIPRKATQRGTMYVVVAALAVAIGEIGLAFLMEHLNDVVRTPEDVSRVLGLNTLGSISQMTGPGNGLVVVLQPRSPEAEAFRMLATNLQITCMDPPLQTILVTSSKAEEGKSLLTANLAATLAQRELRVVAVDADLRVPTLHQYFGIEQGKGLTDSLLNRNGGPQLNQLSPGLGILTSGILPSRPAEMLASGRMRRLLGELAHEADLVLVDAPPVLPVTDASILASIVDGVVIVVYANKTRHRELRESVENLRKARGHVLGVILNGVSAHRRGYHKYYQSERGEATTWQRWRKKLSGKRVRLGEERGLQWKMGSKKKHGLDYEET